MLFNYTKQDNANFEGNPLHQSTKVVKTINLSAASWVLPVNNTTNNNGDLCCAQTVKIYDSTRGLQCQIIDL